MKKGGKEGRKREGRERERKRKGKRERMEGERERQREGERGRRREGEKEEGEKERKGEEIHIILPRARAMTAAHSPSHHGDNERRPLQTSSIAKRVFQSPSLPRESLTQRWALIMFMYWCSCTGGNYHFTLVSYATVILLYFILSLCP